MSGYTVTSPQLQTPIIAPLLDHDGPASHPQPQMTQLRPDPIALDPLSGMYFIPSSMHQMLTRPVKTIPVHTNTGNQSPTRLVRDRPRAIIGHRPGRKDHDLAER